MKAQDPELHHIATESYLYLYPLVLMDVTRRQMTHLSTKKSHAHRVPMNEFSHLRSYPPSSMRDVIRPNFDTLYSLAWLDVSSAPMVVSVPPSEGRYYMLPLMDMWTDVFANIGTRTTGSGAGTYVISSRDWRGVCPADHVHVVSPTPQLWLLGRTQTNGPTDYAAVHRFQDQLVLKPFQAQPKREFTKSIEIPFDPDKAPDQQVEAMDAATFFAYGFKLLALHPPHLQDQPILARMKRMGLQADLSFQFTELTGAQKSALQSSVEEAYRRMAWRATHQGIIHHHWALLTESVGVYGTNYLARATIAKLGLGANCPEDAVYPLHLGEDDGKSLHGSHRYRIRFREDQLPPVEAFWSLTLYGEDGFPVDNSLSRHALSSWMPMQRDHEGTIEIYLQRESPGKEREANWLPTPDAPFNLTLRLYAPKTDVLLGKWKPPAVKRAH